MAVTKRKRKTKEKVAPEPDKLVMDQSELVLNWAKAQPQTSKISRIKTFNTFDFFWRVDLYVSTKGVINSELICNSYFVEVVIDKKAKANHVVDRTIRK